MTLKELRTSKGISIETASKLCGITRKTYSKYEKNESLLSNVKKDFFYNALNSYGYIDESHGILTLNKIKEICSIVFKEYDVEYAILFGSYAKNNAQDNSDIDLLISSNVRGINYFGMVERLRESLKKKVNVLDVKQLINNIELTNEILKDGIKIYG